jgi:hypothetical protein
MNGRGSRIPRFLPRTTFRAPEGKAAMADMPNYYAYVAPNDPI